jgi:hypothetical protein
MISDLEARRDNAERSKIDFRREDRGGWPTFTFFVKVGTTRLAAWAGSRDAEGVVNQ